jgi:DNA-directed RNA polymerase specialized sigma24 family protein
MEIVPLEAFEKLIRAQATKCWYKMPDPKPYTVEDLCQEGVVIYYDAVKHFDPSRGQLITLFYRMLTNTYQYLLDLSIKRYNIYNDEHPALVNKTTKVEHRHISDMFYKKPSNHALRLAMMLLHPPDGAFEECKSYRQRQLKAFVLCGYRIGHGDRLLRDLAMCLSPGASLVA